MIKSITFRSKEIRYYDYQFPILSVDWFMNSELSFIEKYLQLQKDDVFLDIGCAVGSWSIPALLLGARVIGFEPLHLYYSVILDNINLNGCGANFYLSQRVLWDKDDELIPYRYGSYQYAQPMEPFFVKSLKLDSITLPKIDLIKIDVEGSEEYVLKGAVATLEKHRPKIILEHHVSQTGPIENIMKLLPGYAGLQKEDGKWMLTPK